MRLTRATPKAIDYACKHFHYAKAVPVNTVGYNVYNGADEWCGVILYGTGANRNLGTEYGLPQGGVLELVRVALNGKQEQTSMAVAMSIKQLKKDVPHCRLVVSYADCDQQHLGTIYQATNWIYVGLRDKGDYSFIIKGKKTHRKTVHSHMVVIDGIKRHCPETIEAVRKFIDARATIAVTEGKRKYLMPLDKKMRKQIVPLAKPYPKNEEWVKIDRNSFKQVNTHPEGENDCTGTETTKE